MAPPDDQTDWQQIRDRLNELDYSPQSDHSDEQRVDILARRAERYRSKKDRKVADTVELVVFNRRDHRYAAVLDDLDQIRRAGNFQAVPGVSPVVAGVINVRGEIVAIHDLAAFRDEPAPLDEDNWVLVGRTDDVLLALVADHVEGVETPARDAISSVPLSLDSPHGEFQGVLDETTLVLDFEGLTDNDDFFMA